MVEKPQARGTVQPHHNRLVHRNADLCECWETGLPAPAKFNSPMPCSRLSAQPFYGLKFEGRSFDCGSKIGFLTANVAYGLERPDIAPELRSEMRRLLGEK